MHNCPVQLFSSCANNKSSIFRKSLLVSSLILVKSTFAPWGRAMSKMFGSWNGSITAVLLKSTNCLCDGSHCSHRYRNTMDPVTTPRLWMFHWRLFPTCASTSLHSHFRVICSLITWFVKFIQFYRFEHINFRRLDSGIVHWIWKGTENWWRACV